MHKSSSKAILVGSPILPSISLTDLTRSDVRVLFAPFPKIISRELPFAIAKFLTFDIVAKYLEGIVNAAFNMQVQVGVGPKGLAISAFAGAVAGVAGAVVIFLVIGSQFFLVRNNLCVNYFEVLACFLSSFFMLTYRLPYIHSLITPVRLY